MPVSLDTEKALPNEKLPALFLAVGWTTEEGAAEHAQHFNIPFCGSSYVVSAWDGDTLVGFYEKHGFILTAVGEDCVFMRRPCPLFG